MWIRKTDEELLKPLKKSLLNQYLPFLETRSGLMIFYFIIIPFLDIIISFICNIIAGGEGNGRRYPGSFDRFGPNEALSRIPHNLFQGLFLGFILYCLFVLILKVHKQPKNEDEELNYVCDKCNKMSKSSNPKQCRCGGEFVNFNKMKWVNDDQ